MKKTLNNLNTELQAIADAHLQVNTYYWGDFLSAINQDKAVTYPLMCCFVTGNSLIKLLCFAVLICSERLCLVIQLPHSQVIFILRLLVI